MKMLNYDRKLT
jgi:hypothetical protein